MNVAHYITPNYLLHLQLHNTPGQNPNFKHPTKTQKKHNLTKIVDNLLISHQTNLNTKYRLLFQTITHLLLHMIYILCISL